MAENDNDKDNEKPLTYEEEDGQEGSVFRWMSALVVLLAVAGFFGLAWYAYKSGGDAVDDKDVELIKADKTPVKEAPANPGGMQIPNQDKTVYGLINGGKTEKPTVERILPAPEEPIARSGDTETWMSDKARKKSIGEDAKPDSGAVKVDMSAPAAAIAAPVAPVTVQADETPKKAEQFNPAKALTSHDSKAAEVKTAMSAPQEASPAAGEPKPASDSGKQNGPAVAPLPPMSAPSTPSVSQPAPAQQKGPATASPQEQEASAPDKTASTSKPPKGVRVQLGAYKTEAEASSNWTRISKKLTLVQDKQHYVVRADLGEKGVFYRLQLAPFASASEAAKFCATLSVSGQGCIVAKGK